MLKVLSSHLNEKSAQRVARSITYIELIITSLDSDCSVGETGHHRCLKDAIETVQQIVADLLNQGAFNMTPGRAGYPSFLKFNSNFLAALDYREIYTWMVEKLKLWGEMYER